jgi:hypothetical protein
MRTLERGPGWHILETKGFRFVRTDPNTDPQGLNLVPRMELAADYIIARD